MLHTGAARPAHRGLWWLGPTSAALAAPKSQAARCASSPHGHGQRRAFFTLLALACVCIQRSHHCVMDIVWSDLTDVRITSPQGIELVRFMSYVGGDVGSNGPLSDANSTRYLYVLDCAIYMFAEKVPGRRLRPSRSRLRCRWRWAGNAIPLEPRGPLVDKVCKIGL